MAYSIGVRQLNSFQKQVLDECFAKKNGGLSLPMGSGKTLLSLVLGLKLIQESKQPILIVVSKTLISSWVDEIHKFFGKSLLYCVLHPDFLKKTKTMANWKLASDCSVVITSSNVIAKYYKDERIEKRFIINDTLNTGMFNVYTVTRYCVPNEPYSQSEIGAGTIYAMRWGCLIVDEIQKFTNATTQQCRGLAALCSKYRWGLSGTMFDEPKMERILGYHLIINHPEFPRNLPDATSYVKNQSFTGVANTIVQRRTNEAFKPPRLNEVIVKHSLSVEEEKIYMCMKDTFKDLNKEIEQYKLRDDTVNVRRFGSYILAMITYLRQSLVCPLIPIASTALDMANYDEKSILSQMLNKVLRNLEIDDWLQRESSVISSRIQKVLDVAQQHDKERIIVFTSFRSCLDVLKSVLPKNRQQYVMTSTMNTKTRAKTLEEFRKSANGVYLLTYDIGAEGLNIQCSHTVLLMDLWWNSAKTKQAISRVFRLGQTSEVVNVYYFTSNTGVEGALFNKQSDKLVALDEIQHGPLKTAVKSMHVKQIIKLLNIEENVGKLQTLKTKA